MSDYEKEIARRKPGETRSDQVRREAYEDFNRAIKEARVKEDRYQEQRNKYPDCY